MEFYPVWMMEEERSPHVRVRSDTWSQETFKQTFKKGIFAASKILRRVFIKYLCFLSTCEGRRFVFCKGRLSLKRRMSLFTSLLCQVVCVYGTINFTAILTKSPSHMKELCTSDFSLVGSICSKCRLLLNTVQMKRKGAE